MRSQGIFQEVKVCELGLKGNYTLARQEKGSVGRNLYVQRHGYVQHHGACPIVSHLIGALGFGEWKNVVWAGIPDALLLAVHLFYLFITFNFETIIGSVVVAKIVQRGLVYPLVSSPGFILHNYSTVSKPGI